MDADGRVDRHGGMRSFVAGTGGGELYPFRRQRAPGSELRWGMASACSSWCWSRTATSGSSSPSAAGASTTATGSAAEGATGEWSERKAA